MNPDSNLPGIELYDKNGVKFDDAYKNVELDMPWELFDKNGKGLDSTYKKPLSDKTVIETYEENRKIRWNK